VGNSSFTLKTCGPAVRKSEKKGVLRTSKTTDEKEGGERGAKRGRKNATQRGMRGEKEIE